MTGEPMGWGKILLILVIVSLAMGALLGLLREVLGFSGGTATAGAGAAVGVCGALLLARRRAALARRKSDR